MGCDQVDIHIFLMKTILLSNFYEALLHLIWDNFLQLDRIYYLSQECHLKKDIDNIKVETK